jgi:hypothetical protein
MNVKLSGLPKHAEYVPEWGPFVLIPGVGLPQVKAAPDTVQSVKSPVSKPPLPTRPAAAGTDAKRSKMTHPIYAVRIANDSLPEGLRRTLDRSQFWSTRIPVWAFRLAAL